MDSDHKEAELPYISSLGQDQAAALLQALPPEAAPVGDVLAPHEAGRSAPAPNTVRVAVEPVVAIGDDREILGHRA